MSSRDQAERSALLIASLRLMKAGIPQVNFGASSGGTKGVKVTVGDTKRFNKVHGFTRLHPAQKSVLCMATAATEKKVEIFNWVNSLFNRLLEGVSDAGALGGRGGESLMWAGVTGIVLVKCDL